jgi:hypothetical protein
VTRVVAAYQLQSRSLEGHEAFGVVRAEEEEADDPESKGARLHWIASYRWVRSRGPDRYQHLSNRNHFSGALRGYSRFDLRRRKWNHD